MKFRPCIDLHNGQVKQIVGSTLTDTDTETPAENFATDRPAADYAEMYQRDKLKGGHVIKLGPGNDDAAKAALNAYPKGLQIGGGINDENALEWLDAGASHVIVTSHVFNDGKINYERLSKLVEIVGKERLVLDLSCRRKPSEPDGPYYVVTDRWQKYTEMPVNEHTLKDLGEYCSEFLVHGVEVEGKRCGILEDLVVLLGKYSPVSVTYAGGARSIDDMERVLALGEGKVDLTIGSALDCFGGSLKYDDVVMWHNEQNSQST